MTLALWYLAVGLAYALVQGLRNRSMLRRAATDVAEKVESEASPTAKPGGGWATARLLVFVAVLFWSLCWPVGLVLDLRDWWTSAHDRGIEDEL